MLETFRRYSSSIVVKILFLLLILSFGVWGIADVFRPRQDAEWAAKVGDTTISAHAFANEYEATVRRLAAGLGGQIDKEQARALGLPKTVIGHMVNRSLLDSAANDFGITVDDAVVRNVITNDRRFHSATGQFDRTIFDGLLRQNGLTEDRYVAILRQEIGRQQLVGSLTAGTAVPQLLVNWINAYEGQQRVATVVKIADAEATNLPAPSETDLEKYYKDNTEQFRAPEYRSASTLILHADDIARNIKIDDDVLRQAYQERIDDFGTPERRIFRQILLPDEQTAKMALQRLQGGEDFRNVAKDLAGLDAEALEIGPVARDQLPHELAGAVFGSPVGLLNQPIMSPLGWHMVEVTRIDPAIIQPFDTVKDRLAPAIAKEKALDALVELGNKLDDALGRGTSLQDAAQDLGLAPRKVAAVDKQGKDPQGKPIADLPAQFAETVFATSPNSESSLVEADRDTIFVVRVDDVLPSAIAPFETVRDAVRAAWLASQREQNAKRLADELAGKTNSGTDLAILATQRGLKANTAGPYTRAEAASIPDFPSQFATTLFAAKRGEVVALRGTDAHYVIQLSDIREPSPTTAGDQKNALRQTIASQIGEDLLAQLSDALRRSQPVTINTKLLEEKY